MDSFPSCPPAFSTCGSRLVEHIKRTPQPILDVTVEEKIEALVKKFWTALGACFLQDEGKSPPLFVAWALLVPRLIRRLSNRALRYLHPLLVYSAIMGSPNSHVPSRDIKGQKKQKKSPAKRKASWDLENPDSTVCPTLRVSGCDSHYHSILGFLQ